MTIIIGRNSNLSKALIRKLKDCFLVSSREINENIETLSKYKDKKINIIFNNFQAATQLNDLSNNSNYITNTILITSKILDYFQNTEINKIIYTSSSSVYGNNILCSEQDDLKPLNLHSSLKIANEKLIEKYCHDNNIDFSITRIFNMYGGNDKFSIISKILYAAKNNEVITIINSGNAIRDFIHIDDVVDMYFQLLNIEVKIINIGTGNGVSLKSILDFLHDRGVDLKLKSLKRNELKISIADTKLLNTIFDNKSFNKVEEYLAKELNL